MRKFFGIVAKILAIVLAVIVLSVLAVQLFYPRLSQGYKTVEAVYVTGSDYDSRVKVSDEDGEYIYSLIKKSIIGLDLAAGDNCGCDGPGVFILYTDGTVDMWGCAEGDHTCFSTYREWKFGATSAWLYSDELLDTIENYT